MNPLPTSLRVVVILFIISGVMAAIDIVLALFNHRITFNLGVLTIFIGIGLLGRNPRSLSWALFVTWLELAFTVVLGILFLITPGTIQFFGRKGVAPVGLGFVLSAVMFALAYWQLKILTNPQIRAVFGEELISPSPNN
ncbi:hypothetical protein EON83_01590 [bacterium]|nr:MAG: hypothetical protein EON83_01590 [bacterium]